MERSGCGNGGGGGGGGSGGALRGARPARTKAGEGVAVLRDHAVVVNVAQGRGGVGGGGGGGGAPRALTAAAALAASGRRMPPPSHPVVIASDAVRYLPVQYSRQNNVSP